MKAKRKGTRQEHRTMALLEAAGYRCIRSGGSLGEWDVVALGPLDVVLVQVKSNRNPGSLELAALRDSCAWPHVRRLIHVWRNYRRTPDVTEL
jgi:Holliday junction resolvase-like predicted endonuclease